MGIIVCRLCSWSEMMPVESYWRRASRREGCGARVVPARSGWQNGGRAAKNLRGLVICAGSFGGALWFEANRAPVHGGNRGDICQRPLPRVTKALRYPLPMQNAGLKHFAEIRRLPAKIFERHAFGFYRADQFRHLRPGQGLVAGFGHWFASGKDGGG